VARLLLIDDDPAVIREQLTAAFPAPEYRTEIAETGAEGVAAVRRELPDAILLDLRLPDQSGLAVYEAIRELDARVPVIFVTLTKAADFAIEAVKQGAFDYLAKPLDLERLRRVVGEALEVARRMRAPVALDDGSDEGVADGGLVGHCPAMLDVYKAVGRVAAQDVTVLITGESGTGKELVARAIYQHSTRARAPFYALNCAAIPENLLESELFGHERGAFTGADRRRIGRFEQCHGGTILLDEIGDMPLALQAKILRVLQEQTFERIGGGETLRADVRIIAATHRDLRARAAEERFRSDLYYRLSVFSIELPPLRERGDDLALLVRRFLGRYAREFGRQVRDISPEALAELTAYAWPGNVRELQSVIKQALLHATGDLLVPGFLPDLKTKSARGNTRPPSGSQPDLEAFVRAGLSRGTPELYAQTHDQVDRLLFKLALDHTGGNQRDAAKILGISRQTLRVKLRALGLQLGHAIDTTDDDSAS